MLLYHIRLETFHVNEIKKKTETVEVSEVQRREGGGEFNIRKGWFIYFFSEGIKNITGIIFTAFRVMLLSKKKEIKRK